MSSDSDSELPTMTVINSRSGADFEAGRGQPRGEHVDVEVSEATRRIGFETDAQCFVTAV